MNNQGGVNKVFLVGEISRQPRWHKNAQDGAMLCFALKTRDIYLQKGQPVEHTEEHTIKIPEQKLQEELQLGQLLYIEGKLKTTSFTDEQLVKRYKTEILVVKVNILAKL